MRRLLPKPARAGGYGRLLDGVSPIGADGCNCAIVVAGCGSGSDSGHRTADGKLTVESPAGDAKVAWPAKLVMKSDGVVIEPVGDSQVRDGAGHYHVMVDADCLKKGTAIPKDADHLHFGSGATTLTLGSVAPGSHELCVQVGDGGHAALDATDSVTITVGAVSPQAWVDTANTNLQAPERGDREAGRGILAAHPGLIDGSVPGRDRRATRGGARRLLGLLRGGRDDEPADHRGGRGAGLPRHCGRQGCARGPRGRGTRRDAFGAQLLRDRPRTSSTGSTTSTAPVPSQT